MCDSCCRFFLIFANFAATLMRSVPQPDARKSTNFQLFFPFPFPFPIRAKAFCFRRVHHVTFLNTFPLHSTGGALSKTAGDKIFLHQTGGELRETVGALDPS